MTARAVIRFGGLCLAGGALAFLGLFSYLAARFNYPDVLDGLAATVLPSLLPTGPPGRSEQLPAPGVHDHSRSRAGALAGGSRVCGRLTRSGGSVSLRPQPLRPQLTHNPYKEPAMAENVYKVIELVGTSPESWEKAAAAAVKRAGKTLRDLRVAEISQLDMQLKDGKVESYRAKIKVSFKYEGD